MNRRILIALTTLSLMALACGVNVHLPVTPIPVGPDVTDTISVPAPVDGQDVTLSLTFGAGELSLSPGSGADLVNGTATYNFPDLKPTVTTNGSSILIEQGDLHLDFTGIPNMDDVNNTWDLALGSMPMDLNIQAGAYQGRFELGGLSLTGLTVQDGASDVELSFSAPNLVAMGILRYETGASSVELTGLGNANFSTLIFNGGAGNYTLDFSGSLQRDATATIDTGLSNLTLVIPEGVPAQVTFDSGLTNITAGSGWSHAGDVYTQTGSGPTLMIVVEAGAGNVSLTH